MLQLPAYTGRCFAIRADAAVLFVCYDFVTIFTYYVTSPGTHFFCAAFFTFHLSACMVFNGDNYADTESDSAY
jgi:hypothetical protein